MVKGIARGVVLLAFAKFFPSCESTDHYNLPTYQDGILQAVVEIPAGTNLKMEYDAKSRKITPDQHNGQDRRIGFLGYPGNYVLFPQHIATQKMGVMATR